ncbi:hypothetical protein BBY44_005278 [Escherichia coli]|nr:hypothetical protein [Escherichia coli]
MAAQGFLLIATFLLVLMVLARPLGSGLARLINDIPLPGTTGVERVLYSAAIFLIPICISFDTAEKRRYATYLILNRRFSFEF